MLSLFFPWVVREWESPRIIGPPGFVYPVPKLEWSFFELIPEPNFTVILLVFLIGTVVALFHRVGVIPQALGLLGFALTAHSYISGLSVVRSAQPDLYFGPGYFIALVGLFISMFAAKNFWWQRKAHTVVPSISRIAALAPNSTRSRW
jgi:hypothetical protein